MSDDEWEDPQGPCPRCGAPASAGGGVDYPGRGGGPTPPDPGEPGQLYEPCPVCRAPGATGCPGCGGAGYLPTGVSTAQFEKAVADMKRLQHVRALRLSLESPGPGPAKGPWVCRTDYETGLRPGTPRRFEGETPEAAIDAAIKGIIG